MAKSPVKPELYQYEINQLIIRHFDSSYTTTGIPGYPISTNGSFFSGGVPNGPYQLGAVWGVGNSAIAYCRGGVGVVSGHQILVRRLIISPGHAAIKQDLEDNLRASFGGDLPQPFMGGGFMIIENGVAVSMMDLQSNQHYSTGNSGKQLETNNHILLGNTRSKVFLVIAIQMDYAKIQTRLLGDGYTHLCMFDGGKAFWVRTPELTLDGTTYGTPECPYFALGAQGTLFKRS